MPRTVILLIQYLWCGVRRRKPNREYGLVITAVRINRRNAAAAASVPPEESRKKVSFQRRRRLRNVEEPRHSQSESMLWMHSPL